MKNDPTFTDGALQQITPAGLSMAFSQLAEPWLILDSAYASLWAAALRLQAGSWMEKEDEDDDFVPKYVKDSDGIAVLSICGPIMRSPEGWMKKYFGVRGQEDIAAELDRFAADGSARALVLNIDSPGGHAMGCPELAAKVKVIDAKKPIVGFTSGYMASAAYYIGSQGSAVIATASSQVGCIGTLLTWLDLSEYYAQMGVKREVMVNDGATFKGMGLPGTSLTPEQREHLQSQITKMGDGFKADVRAKRNCGDDAMRGQCHLGNDAVTERLVDQVGDLKTAMTTALAFARMNTLRNL